MNDNTSQSDFVLCATMMMAAIYPNIPAEERTRTVHSIFTVAYIIIFLFSDMDFKWTIIRVNVTVGLVAYCTQLIYRYTWSG
jgi:hypothetical protein